MEFISWKNMEISILGMKFRLEVVVLIVILYWILWGHVICSCSRVGLLEGLETMQKVVTNKKKTMDVIDGPSEATDANKTTQEEAASVNPDLPSLDSFKESFVGANTNYGESSRFSLSNDKPVNTSSWFTTNLTYKSGQAGGKGVQDILNRPEQQIPLPEGEMLMFANTPFKAECCPNAYSNSTGCACMDVGQYNYLINRGGNNVPYSEY
jgi:hypothetical protein